MAHADKEKRMNRKQSVFANGTQFLAWRSRNCTRCVKQWAENKYSCEIEKALDAAYINDGLVDRKILERMGFSMNANKYTWDCPERVLNESVESFNNAEPY